MYDFWLFVCAFAVILLVRSYAERLSIIILSEYRIRTRIQGLKSLGNNTNDDMIVSEEESIGLSGKGPNFGESAILSYIADKNQDLIDDMKALLIKAGQRQENALEEFLKSKLNAALALFIMLLLLLGTNDFDIPPIGVLVISLIAGVYGGHKLTDLNMELMAKKRMESIEHGVPDLVDLLVICTESGLDLNSSIRRIAREMRTSNSVLADELSLTAIELEMIPDSRKVFENLENRTDCLEIKTLSKTLMQSIEYGSSLSSSLRELAAETRQRRMLDAEGKAAQAPTLLTLPMMIFIMPCLFIIMLGPVIISMIRSFSAK